MYQGGQTFLPLRVNQAGVIPIIFAISILLFPARSRPTSRTRRSACVATIATAIVNFLNAATRCRTSILYFLLTVGFTYFYTAFTFKPDETADQLRKNGGFIPGIRPGRRRRTTWPRSSPGSRSPAPSSWASSRAAAGPRRLILAGTCRARPRRHGPPDRRLGRRRDDEADRGAADDAQLRRLHPVMGRGTRRPADDRRRPPRGAGRRQGHPGPVSPRSLGVADPRSGDLFRAAVASGTPLGREADAYHAPGAARARRLIVRVFLDRLDEPDAAGGAILDGFPRTRPRPRRSTRRWPSAAGASTGRSSSRCPTEELIGAPRRPLDLHGRAAHLPR